jgi:hypothetical protein
MNIDLTCTDCESIIECTTDNTSELRDTVECDCGARFIVSVTCLNEEAL